MAGEPTEQEKVLTEKLACFILNYPYEFIEAMEIMAKRICGLNPEESDMSYKIRSYMPQIAALRKERGA